MEKNNCKIILSTAYFVPIQYFSYILSNDIIIERHENYNKQSYRNRCTIYTANGLLDLVVPVAKTGNIKIPITEVEISYDTNWQKQHFRAIESAYRRSPFYQYYIDDIIPFFNCRHRYLYELNMDILQTVYRLLKISRQIRESADYIKPSEEIIDMRNSLHPKTAMQNADFEFVTPHYTQVFANKWGFKSNLSILDLLFNAGNDAIKILTVK